MFDRRATAQILSHLIASTTGRAVVELAVVHGGDTSAAFRVSLDDGTLLFAKTHPDPPPGFFTTEAWGLERMRSADAVNVPTVVAVSGLRSAKAPTGSGMIRPFGSKA